MLMPLPEELEKALVDLSECGQYVDDNQYDADERRSLEKLKTSGLVALGWVVTPAGRQYLNNKE